MEKLKFQVYRGYAQGDASLGTELRVEREGDTVVHFYRAYGSSRDLGKDRVFDPENVRAWTTPTVRLKKADKSFTATAHAPNGDCTRGRMGLDWGRPALAGQPAQASSLTLRFTFDQPLPDVPVEGTVELTECPVHFEAATEWAARRAA